MNPRVLLVALLVIVAAAGAFVVLGDSDDGPPDRQAMFVVGDGLLFAEDNDDEVLVAAFAERGFDTTVGGFAEDTVPSALDNVWPSMAGVDTARVLVLALGTNDSRLVDGERQVPLRESEEALAWWLYQARSIPCVLLVGVNENASAWGLDETGAAFNQMLADQASEYPNVGVIDWDPTDMDVPDVEQVFVGPETRELYRETIVEDVSRRCG